MRNQSVDKEGAELENHLLKDAVRVTTESKAKRWRASRYNVRSRTKDGDLLLFNTFSGELIQIDAAQAPEVLASLGTKGVGEDLSDTQQVLVNTGILVDQDVDEMRRARYQHEQWKRNQSLTLIIMPHENCNFRCTYCYEEFPRNKMEPWVRESLKKWVHSKCRSLKQLTISWFGGEPLLAPDVIAELSESFMASCKELGVRYKALMTTNGYLLTPEVVTQMQKAEVRSYQITLDGPECTHNQTRKLAGGGGTFQRIYENLRYMHNSDEQFEVAVRMNFDSNNVGEIPEFIEKLKQDFGGDARFKTHFHPVGQWGGPNDDVLPVCDSREAHKHAFTLLDQSVEAGFSNWLSDMIKPFGTTCYAADPNSFVVGADGTVYKCTVALYNPKNKVGAFRENGTMYLDHDLHALWTTSDAEGDTGCQSCHFRPSCQGAACPLVRIEMGVRPCPPIKTHLKEAIRLVARELSGPPSAEPVLIHTGD
jgi:uncharacterized protein